MNIHLGPLWIHRLEQWDLDCWPLVCIHWRRPGRSTRIFCLWRWGIQVRPFMLSPKAAWYGSRLLWKRGMLSQFAQAFRYFRRDLGHSTARAVRSAWREARRG